ncbi:hypothetical protein J3Z89_002034 [Escherichia coli]|nr:hypothetical protein [Escherichia coli]
MSHPIIHIGRYHGGSDDWRTPYRLFHNLHREYSFSLDGAATKHDTLLPRFTDDIHNQSWVGEKVFCNPPETLDRLIKMHGQGQSVKSIAESLRMPLSTTYKIVQRLS